MPITRKLFITGKDGIEVEIKSKADLNAILAQMTPEERKNWELRYRFTPITNKTGLNDYTGTSRDLSS